MNNRFTTKILALATLLSLGMAVTQTACMLEFGAPTENDGNDAAPPPSNQPTEPTASSSVRVVLINATEAALETEFFVSSSPLTDPATDLFSGANLFITGIGLAGTGLLAPGEADSADVPCTDDLTIGTRGGKFLDAETGDDLGTGTTRVLQAGLVFDCGDDISFAYRLDGDQYTVEVSLD